MRRHALLALVLASSACAHQAYGPGPVYDGRDYAGPRAPYEGDLHGPGVEILDEWLKGTTEGREIVTLGFRDAAEGFVGEDVAHRANIWFRRHADTNRDMKVTDPEIRTALANSAVFQRRLRR